MIISNVNVLKLLDEFNHQNINPYPVFDYGDGRGYFAFTKDTNMGVVQQIIDAHVPTPIPPTPTIEERTEQLENIILMMMEVM